MQEMNLYYRQKDYPTDVLTFKNDANDDSLGDIIISLPKAFEQAEKLKHSHQREISFLAVHGYLHLKGYEDETEEGLLEMIEIQDKILKEHHLDK
ncbi:rRNA maturation RNase YbeY [Candidatus Phytoplasma pruni]|uniref:rRNA maturation RNase YbeY n=1 Tax=Candidatus Phytoplasma pruni TaxID=479893 RepID=A0A851HII8_9MOLU|nr:rRNA maturation RNase YbeY [Candidatus Phytoplasma pruni]NWN46114.1 rRNA maturation RNase YbeY [Candidatus Phytoplasma pruni]